MTDDLILTLDATAPEPPFEQLRAQFAAAIGDGRLSTGARLPAIRRLAGDLGLAANTVARTYRELEQAGLVETRGRGGTVVRGAAERRAADAGRAAAEFAERMRSLGIDRAAALDLARDALA